MRCCFDHQFGILKRNIKIATNIWKKWSFVWIWKRNTRPANRKLCKKNYKKYSKDATNTGIVGILTTKNHKKRNSKWFFCNSKFNHHLNVIHMLWFIVFVFTIYSYLNLSGKFQYLNGQWRENHASFKSRLIFSF